ncbi:MAG: MlaD family protein [Pseudomonadota bacterium]
MDRTEIDRPEIKKERGGGISAVWIVPILAALIGGAVAYRSLANQGPLVEIEFEAAKGIAAGKTEIKHKDVVIGIVEEVRFAEGLESVVVSARLDLEIEPYLGETTDFWVVSANISGTDLSGLGTILSGSYIEVDWSGPPSETRRVFDGLEKQPLTPPSAEGRHLKMKSARAGSVNIGSPVYFRGIQVGRVESRDLSEDNRSIEYSLFIEAPHDDLISRATHFWNVSGVSVETSTDGLAVNFASLQALLGGGVEFGDIGVDVSSVPLAEDFVFTLFEDQRAAIENQYTNPDEAGVQFMVSFDDSVGGLEPGAPVEWQGIRIGTVNDLRLDLAGAPGSQLVNVIIELQPSRIGIAFSTVEEAQRSIQDWVTSGMRVRLATGNILTGKKLIRFVDAIGTDTVTVDFNQPIPRLPTAPSNLNAITQDAEQLVQNLAELPLEDLVVSAVRLLDNTNALVANPDLQDLPGELNTTLASFDSVAGRLSAASENLPMLIENLNQIADAGESTLTGLSPDSQLYVDLSGAVRDLRDAARSLSALASRLEEQPNSLITGRN